MYLLLRKDKSFALFNFWPFVLTVKHGDSAGVMNFLAFFSRFLVFFWLEARCPAYENLERQGAPSYENPERQGAPAYENLERLSRTKAGNKDGPSVLYFGYPEAP